MFNRRKRNISGTFFKKEAILEKTRTDLEKKRLEKATYMVRHQRLIEKIIEKKKELDITEDIFEYPQTTG